MRRLLFAVSFAALGAFLATAIQTAVAVPPVRDDVGLIAHADEVKPVLRGRDLIRLVESTFETLKESGWELTEVGIAERGVKKVLLYFVKQDEAPVAVALDLLKLEESKESLLERLGTLPSAAQEEPADARQEI